MATVTFSHVSKIFDQRRDGLQRAVRAVDDVSLKLEDGEFLAVLGPSWLWQVDLSAFDRRAGNAGRRRNLL